MRGPLQTYEKRMFGDAQNPFLIANVLDLFRFDHAFNQHDFQRVERVRTAVTYELHSSERS